MAAPMQPAGFEAEFDDYDDFDGDGFFLGDVNELNKKKDVIFPIHQNGDTKSPVFEAKSTFFGSHLKTRAHPKPRDPTVRLVPARDAFVPGSQTMTVDDLRTAVMRGNVELVGQYLDRGFEVDTVLRSGWTGLMYAASCCHHEMVQLFIDRGADVNVHKDQYSCLMAVCSSSKGEEGALIDCVTSLLDRGCDVNAFDRYHMTSLMYAAREGRPDLVLLLVERGADVNKQDHKGWTALVWAVSRGHANVTSLLVRHGADVRLKCRSGQTAGDVAASQGYHLICDVLEKLGREERPQEQTLSELSAVAPTPSVALVPLPTRPYERYGELELFLSGLDCGHLIEVFKQQEITFSTLLRMSDDDLLKAGVTKLGERRKLIEGVHAVHKKDWKESSLAPTKYTKHLTSGDVLSSLGNISKHLDYIGATLAYLEQQVRDRPEMMRQASDANCLLKLRSYTDDSLSHTQKLHGELCQIQQLVDKMIGTGEYQPVDLVRANGKKKKSYFKFKTPSKRIVAIACLGGFLIWKREFFLTYTSGIVNKLHRFIGR